MPKINSIRTRKSKFKSKYWITFTYYPEGWPVHKSRRMRDWAYGETAQQAISLWKKGRLFPKQFKNIQATKIKDSELRKGDARI